MLIVAAIHGLICFAALLAWRRVGNHSIAKATMEVMGEIDRRSLYSGNYAPGTQRRKVGPDIRAFAWQIFLSSAQILLLAVGAAMTLFGVTLAAHVALGLISDGSVNTSYITDKAVALSLGFVNAASFDLFTVFGIDRDLVERSTEARVVNFAFLLSLVFVTTNALIATAWNLVALTAAMAFPVSFIRAADPKILIEENTWLERMIFRVLDFGGVSSAS